MEQNILVSVIIPNYNHSAFLEERIESVLSQTYQNYEIIILDDASTDNSKEIIEKYRENTSVKTIIYNKKNSGRIFSQWQKGIRLAKGELIWIAESDDKCKKDLLEKLVTEFQKDEKLSVAFCKTIAFYDNGNESRINPIPCERNLHFSNHVFISQYMTKGCPMLNASACLFKKSIALEIEDLYSDMKGAGDRMFWVEMCEKGNIAIVNEWLNLMRFHLTNSTKKHNLDGTNQKDDKVILDYIFKQKYINKAEYDQLRFRYAKYHIFQMIEDKHLKQELYKIWGISAIDKMRLKIDAWCNKILKAI